jgi:hypothetical protein
VAARKVPVAASSVRQRESREAVSRIVAQRERLVADVRLLRDRGGNSKFIENAQQLLTRWWSPASWKAREELLKTADWLVRLEKHRTGQLQSPALR